MNDVSAPADPFAAVTHANPYPYYADLVRNRPLYFDERLATWVASGADAASAVFANDALRVRPIDEPIPPALQHTAAGDLFGKFIRMYDGAERNRLKSVVASRIDTLDLGRVVRATEASAAPLLERLGRPLDWRRFTSDFALRLPSHVLTRLLDLDVGAAPAICDWLDDFAQCLSPSATPDEIDSGSVAADHLVAAMNPNTGFVADLSREVRLETSADEKVALANAVGLLFQSREGTAGLIGNALLALSRDKALADKSRRDPDSLHGVVEDVVRDDSPVQNTRRFAAESVSVLNHRIAKGDGMLVVVAAANRDPKANGRIFTFGAGVHACPGAAIALTMATKALEFMFRQGVDVTSVAEAVAYRASIAVRIPEFGQFAVAR